MSEFTHFNHAGEAVMVDVTGKEETKREATAKGSIYMSKSCFEAVTGKEIEKGDVLGIARIAGIMGAKRTSDLIPLCHIINLTNVTISFELDEVKNEITAFCTAKSVGKTGVEMEAIMGVNIALVTIYDMCKAIDKNMRIENIHLIEKSGGKSGHFVYEGSV